jgi:hypothetical protein
MKTLKKNSPLWQKALKYSRRKYVNSKPIGFNEDRTKVVFMGLIRGNTWLRTEKELDNLLNSR